MFPEDLILTSGNREEIFEMRPDYPFCIRDVISRYGEKQLAPWHWHEELEFVYIRKGEPEYHVAGASIKLREKEGIFINSNVMHQVINTSQTDRCEYLVFMFRRNFLAEEGSLLDKKYVLPVIKTNNLQAVVLKNENILQKNILEQLRKTELIEKERQYGYEMQIRNAFADMWISFLHMLNVRPEGVKQQIPEKEERLKKMLTYIHQEYENELSLEDIAKAAGVSKRECLRCFQEEIHITPFNYLKDYRLQRACIALKNTEDTVTSIAQNCGFNSSSYFGKVFRKSMGMTPYEFRNKGES